ncbi:conjugative transposon protein TraM [Flavobacterium johnsoniae]|uniref:Bacteroides conjugative transposon TraM protein n=1 Tax=Flavobacterium johnsoniae TaxID=986 RepID=A0A1M5W517_FLAJO|nr:conjugative transposon protein TraM [Flavobacterium johnsoniae]SHH82304.1 Bacteroides conjugative transposon TraM protein [Flavobacterium johnsoniae]
MEKKTMTLKELKQRKMLFVLPIITLPFLTMLFWILGGGKGNAASNMEEEKRGFNIALPNPKFKEDSALDKMSYYDKATIDSLKLQEQIKKDPNYSMAGLSKDSALDSNESDIDPAMFRKGKTALNTSSFRGENEQKMYQKLEALQKAIAEPPKSISSDQDMREFEYRNSSNTASDEMKNLEQMMSAMNAPSEPDPELKQLGGMLENILDIQHPERVQERLRQTSKSQKGKVFAVNKKLKEEPIGSLQGSAVNHLGNTSNANSFYSLDEMDINNEVQNALEAVIHETQSIVNGSIVKLRLTSDIFINGTFIPRNSFVFGTASLKGERLEIKINTIKFKNSIFPVELSVYDMDGIDGIYIPGAINRDVAKASADRSMQSIGVEGLNDSWGAQAATMGVEAAKSLLSKKVKLIKVVVKAGYQVLLYDEKEKNAK